MNELEEYLKAHPEASIDLDCPQPANIDGEDLKRYGIWLSEFEKKNGRMPTAEEIGNWQTK